MCDSALELCMGELSNEASWEAEELVVRVRFGEQRFLSYASTLDLTTAYFCGDQMQHELNLYYLPGMAMALFPFQIQNIPKSNRHFPFHFFSRRKQVQRN